MNNTNKTHIGYPNYRDVIEYANSVVEGRKIACKYLKRACQRFLSDLQNPAYEMRPKESECAILMIEALFCHQQGETQDGHSLRGTPFLLEPFHKFIIYNLLGFYYKDTIKRRFQEALVFIPRKNIKTSFAAALAFVLSVLHQDSGSKVYITAAALKQSLESFNFILYNLNRLGEADNFRIIDNNQEHSIRGDMEGGGALYIQALAADVTRQDSLNCNFAIADEIHAFRVPKQYTIIKDAMKAYTNKLMMGITTAGDDMNSFCYHQLEYCKKILDGTAKNEKYFVFICEADPDENGYIDYTSPTVHEMANPAYGVSIRPDELLSDAIQAQDNATTRKEFFAKSLNVFTSSINAWFDLDEFRRSDNQYSWTVEELIKKKLKWYGGSDLSKLHDLTATGLATLLDDVLILYPHCWFPKASAHEKADKDQIPLFGWMDDGWLDLCNGPTINYWDMVKWFKSCKAKGFSISQVGHDRRFCREYFIGMKKSGFKIIDQPQYAYIKSEGFRFIERKAKEGKLYYFHADPFEYCVQNVYGTEKSDDIVQYEKIGSTTRIDVFDACVFAVCRMLEHMEEKSNNKLGKYFGIKNKNEGSEGNE